MAWRKLQSVWLTWIFPYSNCSENEKINDQILKLYPTLVKKNNELYDECAFDKQPSTIEIKFEEQAEFFVITTVTTFFITLFFFITESIFDKKENNKKGMFLIVFLTVLSYIIYDISSILSKYTINSIGNRLLDEFHKFMLTRAEFSFSSGIMRLPSCWDFYQQMKQEKSTTRGDIFGFFFLTTILSLVLFTIIFKSFFKNFVWEDESVSENSESSESIYNSIPLWVFLISTQIFRWGPQYFRNMEEENAIADMLYNDKYLNTMINNYQFMAEKNIYNYIYNRQKFLFSSFNKKDLFNRSSCISYIIMVFIFSFLTMLPIGIFRVAVIFHFFSTAFNMLLFDYNDLLTYILQKITLKRGIINSYCLFKLQCYEFGEFEILIACKIFSFICFIIVNILLLDDFRKSKKKDSILRVHVVVGVPSEEDRGMEKIVQRLGKFFIVTCVIFVISYRVFTWFFRTINSPLDHQFKKISQVPTDFRVFRYKSEGESIDDNWKIKIKNQSFSFYNYEENTKFLALKNITVTFDPGQFYLLLGKNGSGKSTLVNLLRGLYSQCVIKNIYIGEKNMRDISDLSIHDSIKCLSVVEKFPHVTWKELITTMVPCPKEEITSEEIEEALEKVGLKNIITNLNEMVHPLSKGQTQRLSSIFIFLLHKCAVPPKVLLLDECFSGLHMQYLKKGSQDDPDRFQYTNTIIEQAAKWGITVIFIAHESLDYLLENLSSIRGIIALEEGRIVQISYSRKEMLKKYYRDKIIDFIQTELSSMFSYLQSYITHNKDYFDILEITERNILRIFHNITKKAEKNITKRYYRKHVIQEIKNRASSISRYIKGCLKHNKHYLNSWRTTEKKIYRFFSTSIKIT